jgi:enoyl-CoA hydratase
MGELVSYERSESIATVTMDDGKVNAMTLEMQGQLHRALDRAEADASAVVLAGRPGVFSAGFHLSTMREGGSEAIEMVGGGFELAARVLSFPYPVVIACTGHALAMGTFLVFSGDYRVGAAGPFKLAANEVAIGLTMPHAATAILRHRLTPSAFDRAVTLAEIFGPHDAIEVGYLDQVVEPDLVLPVAREVATAATMLDLGAHAASKRRARADLLDAIRTGIEADRSELQSLV